MNIPAAAVKELRDRTSLGMMDCKKALQEVGGDMEKAEEHLRKQGLKAAELRAGRSASEGRVGHYIHMNGKIGVLVELNCETDFAAGSDDFAQLIKDLCMQVAATSPKYVSMENVPAELVAKEKKILAEQVKDKPPQIVDKILEGKMEDFYKQICLIEQPYVKDPSQTVGELVKSMNAKLGENLVVRRFVRLELGEEV